ncbi:hypothetical protein JCM11491_005695 [Sporobolomyces phaffii]
MADPLAEERIASVLARARDLERSHRESGQVPVHATWAALCSLIASCRLGELTRDAELEVLYATEFTPLIRAAFGSVERYLRARLDFDDDPDCAGAYWTATSQARVRVNDWGYSVPSDVEHFVVWVNQPLFHSSLCDDDDTSSTTRNTWRFVQDNGVSGLTPAPSQSDESSRGPGREIAKFVQTRWPVHDGYETAWFANPPRLQSVPGLAHFHVMVRKATSSALQ